MLKYGETLGGCILKLSKMLTGKYIKQLFTCQGEGHGKHICLHL